MEWIKVEEKLPRLNDNIICYTPGDDNHLITYRYMLGIRCRLATHWMLLEPPNQEIANEYTTECCCMAVKPLIGGKNE